MNKEKLYSVCKWFAIAFLLAVAFSATQTDAEGVYLKQQYSKSGQSFIRIINQTNYNFYCTITGYRYFKDFTLYANRSSRWYPEPIGKYEWRCR